MGRSTTSSPVASRSSFLPFVFSILFISLSLAPAPAASPTTSTPIPKNNILLDYSLLTPLERERLDYYVGPSLSFLSPGWKGRKLLDQDSSTKAARTISAHLELLRTPRNFTARIASGEEVQFQTSKMCVPLYLEPLKVALSRALGEAQSSVRWFLQDCGDTMWLRDRPTFSKNRLLSAPARGQQAVLGERRPGAHSERSSSLCGLWSGLTCLWERGTRSRLGRRGGS